MEPASNQPVTPQVANPSPSPQPPMTQPTPAVAEKPGGDRSVLLILVIAGIIILAGAVAIGFLLVGGKNVPQAPLPIVAVPTAAPTEIRTPTSPAATQGQAPTPTSAGENPFAATPTPVTNPFEQTVTNPFEGL